MGFGDILPWTSVETVVCMLVQLLGICFFGALLSSISALIQRASKEARRSAAQLLACLLPAGVRQEHEQQGSLVLACLRAPTQLSSCLCPLLRLAPTPDAVQGRGTAGEAAQH